MERDGQNGVGVIEGVLHAVSVVAVDVHVGDSYALGDQAFDGDHGIVENAETVGVIGHRVVQAARDVERRVDIADDEHLRRLDRGSGRQDRSVVHPSVWRVVARPEVVGRRVY